VDRLQASAEAILADLVSFPSLSGTPNGAIVGYIKDYFERLDIPVTLDAHEDGERFNLFATIGRPGDGGILLSGHSDVVPANGPGWTRDPFKLYKENGRLYGRGAVDMKGFLAMAMAMAPAFKDAEDDLQMPLHYAFTFDEEVGSFGAAQMPAFLEKQNIKPSIAIIGEPTGMQPFIGHKGGLEMIAELHGTAGHASDPRGTVNTIYYAARLISFIEAKAKALAAAPDPQSAFDPPYTTLSVGQIEGGEARNIIANSCRFLWEIRPLPEDDPYEILAEIQQFVDHELMPEMRAIHQDASIDLIVDSWCPGMQARMDSVAAALVSRIWTNAPQKVVSFGTDGGHFQNAGMETIVFGPGGMTEMHQPDEFITCVAIAEGLQFLTALKDYMTQGQPAAGSMG
jgi:acetylornithine deacetylase